MNRETLIEAIRGFSNLKLLVIGDVILDAYFKGKVDRISPEAPVPVLDIHSKEFRLGGAANVGLNVKHLGAECIVCSVIGKDQPGNFIRELMLSEHMHLDGLVESEKRPTTIKTRLVSGFSQLLRMDEELTHPLDEKEEAAFLERISYLIENIQPDAIIFEDYDKGVITPMIIKEVVKLAKANAIPITVDPKRRNFFAYEGVDLFKPNLKELKEGLNLPKLSAETDALQSAFEHLQNKMQVKAALFTLSEHGVFVTNGKQRHHIRAIKRSIADVSGAGDTVIATATCALAGKLELESIAFLSNLAGGWVCQFPGVVSLQQHELIEETNKVLGNGH